MSFTKCLHSLIPVWSHRSQSYTKRSMKRNRSNRECGPIRFTHVFHERHPQKREQRPQHSTHTTQLHLPLCFASTWAPDSNAPGATLCFPWSARCVKALPPACGERPRCRYTVALAPRLVPNPKTRFVGDAVPPPAQRRRSQLSSPRRPSVAMWLRLRSMLDLGEKNHFALVHERLH